jgi:transposase
LLGDWLASFGSRWSGWSRPGSIGSRCYYRLEDDFEVWLLNAQHLKNVPGGKTDVADSVWICQLVERGLVRPSFVPPKPIRELRDLTATARRCWPNGPAKSSGCTRCWRMPGPELASVAGAPLGSRAGRCWRPAPMIPRCWPSWPGDGCEPSSRRCGGPAGPLRSPYGLLVGEMLARIDQMDETIERLSAEVARVAAPCSPLLGLLMTIPG